MEFKAKDGKASGRMSLMQVAHHPVIKAMGVVAIALALANCSTSKSSRNKYGVKASPRVVAEGQPVPKGGGRMQVGKPYVVAGRTYVPQENPNYSATGLASWYGSDFHGRLTANGEVFDRYSVAAAHPTMPLPSYARVTNLQNNRSIIVRVNDRGPYHANRVMDVSQSVAEALDFKRSGTAKVKVDYVGKASLNGSDDNALLATLRQDGMPAQLRKLVQPTMVASAEPPQTGSYAMEQGGAIRSPAAQDDANTFSMDDTIPLPPQRPVTLGQADGNTRIAGLSYLAPEQESASSHNHGPFSSVSNIGALSLKR